jgi:glycosyltransferase involved in cell wall biosynthesis
MRLLFITQDYPDPPTMGDRLIAYNLIRVLGRRHRIALFSLSRDASACPRNGDLSRWCDTVHVEQTGGRQLEWMRYLASLPLALPNRYRELRSAVGIENVARIARTERVDLVHGIGLGVAEYMAAIPGLPKVATLIDCASLRQRQFYRASPIGLRKLHHLQNWYKVTRFERRHCPTMDTCVMVSPRDAAALRKSAKSRNVRVISNGVLLPELPSVAGRQSGLLAFSGAMDYWPNVDAACFLAEQVLPPLVRQRPEVTVAVIGRNPHIDLVRRLSRIPQVTVRGYVEDVPTEIGRAMIYVAPLRLGGGVKNKVLEAMATATPVMGTPEAFAGLRVVSGRDVVVCKSAADFVSGANRLLDDPQLREQIGGNGRAYVERHHTWEAICARYEHVYAGLMGGGKGFSGVRETEDPVCPLL